MRVDHRCRDVGVAEELLDGPDVVPGFKEVGRKRVAKRVAGHPLREPCLATGICHCPLDDRLVQVITRWRPESCVPADPCRRKDKLPTPLSRRRWELRS